MEWTMSCRAAQLGMLEAHWDKNRTRATFVVDAPTCSLDTLAPIARSACPRFEISIIKNVQRLFYSEKMDRVLLLRSPRGELLDRRKAVIICLLRMCDTCLIRGEHSTPTSSVKLLSLLDDVSNGLVEVSRSSWERMWVTYCVVVTPGCEILKEKMLTQIGSVTHSRRNIRNLWCLSSSIIKIVATTLRY